MNDFKNRSSRVSRAVHILMSMFLLMACNVTPDTAKMQSGPAGLSQQPGLSDVLVTSDTSDGVITPAVRNAIETMRAGNAVDVRSQNGRVTRIAGNLQIKGVSPGNAFQQFLARHGAVLDVPESQMAPGHWRNGTAESIPLMYEKDRGTYRFTLTRHHQAQGGVPVFGSRIDVLTRNKGNQIVEIVAQTRNLGSFVPAVANQPVNSSNQKAALDMIKAAGRYEQKAKDATSQSLRVFSEPSLTIWAGIDDIYEKPKTAVIFTGSNDNRRNLPRNYLFVADAETGEILYKENLIVHEDITGAVAANVIDGVGPDICDPLMLAAMPNATISDVAGTSVFAAQDGTFTFPWPGSEPVELSSAVRGQYFVVYDNVTTRNEVLSQTVTPPGPASFTHAAIADEYLIAQTNGYHQSSVVRNWLLQYHPAYPVIAAQTAFPIHVNLTSGYCPGNAWYDGSSVNYCEAGSIYPNTAFGSVVHHEYGHHIVGSGGSGQSEYGEGMADTVSMLIADDPGLAYGFLGDCAVPLRSADNDCQYLASGCSTCGSEVHDCGKLLAGIMWDIRNALAVTEPDAYLDVLGNLAINSILLHSGGDIDASIAVDLLTLDDEDGNIGNGTPHRTEICSGFEAHGISCPELEEGMKVLPGSGFEVHGDPGGPFSPESVMYTVENMGPGAITYSVSTSVDWLDVSVTGGSLNASQTEDIDVIITDVANDLPLGSYEGDIVFVNDTTHQGDTTLTVRLSVGGPRQIYQWNLDTNPGWTMDTGWAFGAPLGGGTDPNSAATGTNVFGTNLAGNYSNNMSEHSLTTSAIDCANLSQVSLRYQRWLGVETRTFDEAEISISTDGVTFTPIWLNPSSSLNETAWSLHELDISSIADGQDTVYLRWSLGPTDYSVVYGGWNIDDIEIWGVAAQQPVCTADDQCDDGLYCNGAESCSAEGVCQTGSAVVCNDDVICTQDTCNEATDSCDFVPQNVLCNDGLFCNGEETCSITGCEPGVAVICADTVDCTDEFCNEEIDSCDFVPNDQLCDDGVFCNGAEICDAAGCATGQTPCSDAFECTTDVCDEVNQTCTYTADDSMCDNGLFCDGVETCTVNAGCVSGVTPCAEQCDESFDTCISCSDQTQNGAETDIDCGGGFCDPCDDGLICVIDDDCQSGNCDGGICQEQAGEDVTAELLVTTDWSAGYCVNLAVTNNASSATTSWEVTVDVSTARIYTLWNADYTSDTGVSSLTPLGWNSQIGPGQTQARVGFCVNRTGSEPVATVVSATAQY